MVEVDCLLQDLKTASNDVNSLENFIRENLSQLFEMVYSTPYFDLTQKQDIEYVILLKNHIVSSVDFNSAYNKAFIALLISLCERMDTSSVSKIHEISSTMGLEIGLRLKAALLYLVDIPNNQSLIDRFEQICELLQSALSKEEDGDKMVVFTFLNYYSHVIRNTSNHIQYIQQLQSKILNEIEHNNCENYGFLSNRMIVEAVNYDIYKSDDTFKKIQSLIVDLFSGTSISLSEDGGSDMLMLEQNSIYVNQLSSVDCTFENIKKIAVDFCRTLIDGDKVFSSLGRGVEILHTEEQLFYYIKSYGLMHEAKLKSAFTFVPFGNICDKNVCLCDWGCGQALATIVFKDYITANNLNIHIKKVFLIEPSKTALKRACLHVIHSCGCAVKTINSDLDSVNLAKYVIDKEDVKIHFFSNILDCDGFSIDYLYSTIINNINGENYFVIASPYITDVKTYRIQYFVDCFRNNYSSFVELGKVDNIANEWIHGWTRVVRVFKVIL